MQSLRDIPFTALTFCSFRVVVVSNQAGITLKHDSKISKNPNSKLGSFKSKVSAVSSQLGIPLNVYAATEKDIYRKPRTGMWTELLEDFDLHHPGALDLKNSIFVGDAGGRVTEQGKPKDFSCSDRYLPHSSLAVRCLPKIVTLQKMSGLSFTHQKSSSFAKVRDHSRARLILLSISPANLQQLSVREIARRVIFLSTMCLLTVGSQNAM